MAPTLRAVAVGALAVFAAVGLSGCVTVFPARNILTSDPRASSVVYTPVLAYEVKDGPNSGCPSTGSENRPFYVPDRSEWVKLTVKAHLTSLPKEVEPFDTRHFDLTIKDGSGLTWVDVHLKNNDTNKEVVVEGPRPGAWTSSVSWEICDNSIIRATDQFDLQVVVRQPV